MISLYITQDQIGLKSGGGRVTLEEYKALEKLGPVHPFDRHRMGAGHDPFVFDALVLQTLRGMINSPEFKGVKLAHFYAGTFTETIKFLQSCGIKVSYTCAAHDRHVSAAEYEAVMGEPYSLEHMKDGPLWEKYVGGYRAADLLIVPSTYSKNLMIKYGCVADRIKVIPHGTDFPKIAPPPPKQFTVGYMGSAGTDKGLRHLFKAWAMLDHSDSLMVMAGPYSHIPELKTYYHKYGGGNVRLLGFVPTIDEFFAKISVYIQPSVSEGFGIEILEAMAHGRPVIASEGAGAAELVRQHECGIVVPAGEPTAIIGAIVSYLDNPKLAAHHGERGRNFAEFYQWGRIHNQYVQAWTALPGLENAKGAKRAVVLKNGKSFVIPAELENLDWLHDLDVMDTHWQVKPGDVCIDIGTGPGVWSMAALVQGAAQVHSFDPRPVAGEILNKLLSLNAIDVARCHFEQKGVWSDNDARPFSESSFVWNTNGQITNVPVVTLDRYVNVNKIDRIDYINIDAEGAELHVLTGAKSTMQKFRPNLLIDVHNNVALPELFKKLEVLQPYDLVAIDDYIIVTPR